MILRKLRKNHKIVSILVLSIFIFSQWGCTNIYRIETYEKVNPRNYNLWIGLSKYQYVQYKDGIKEIEGGSFNTETGEFTSKVLGEVNPDWNYVYQKAEGREGKLNRVSKKDIDKVEQFHLFAKNIEVQQDCTIVIPQSDIYKMSRMYYDAAESKKQKKLALWFGLGIPSGAILAFIIALAIACNCPHVYVYNGQDFEMQTALFAGSIHPSLERRDYFVIQNYESEEALRIQIRNEEKTKETQYLNDVRLKAVYHEDNVAVRIDKQGILHTISNPMTPVVAKSLDFVDALSMINQKDEKAISFAMKSDQNDLNEFNLEFFRPKGTNSAKLLLDARNTDWSGYVVDEFFNLFGKEQEKVSKQFDRTSKEQKLKWQKEQGLLLSVYVKRDGKWQFEDYLDMAGTGNLREFVLPIDLNGIKGGRIEVKLKAGFNLWELDYAAIDFSENQDLEVREVAIDHAMFNGEETNLQASFKDENEYLVLEKNGDVLDLQFKQAPKQEGKKLTYVLSSKGYLKKHHDGSGKFNKSKLLSFAKKGAMSRFSRELIQMVNK